MNAKDMKKYSLINAILNSWPQRAELADLFAELAAIDFGIALEVWEYALNSFIKDLGDMVTAQNIESKVFEKFIATSEAKTRQLFVESLPLNKLVYSMCASAGTGANLTFAANLILSTKLEAAEEVLKCLAANKTKTFDYAARMKDLLDTVFTIYCENKGVKKAELNRKQSAMLLEYIGKIKGPNKMLLTQRIKEL